MRAARRRSLYLLGALLCLAPGARSAPRSLPRPEFTLVDHAGRTRRLADFRGRVVALAFGYTQCPDVCPTTLALLAQVKRDLGRDAGALGVLFVTVDPARDTQALLAAYVTAFDPAFTGLRGDAQATKRATEAFEVTAERREGRTPESYTVDHTAAIFLLDARGYVRGVIGYDQGPAAILRDVRRLLSEAPRPGN